ncbi:hypothetical protein EDD16DRAFT_1528336 [Pisolithus croceorrhizus]|nr:hypothetical protein EDD16DRAFT_1528336 [Pisolithus croceorrhizus]
MSVWTCKSKSGHLQTRGEIIEMEGLRLKLDHESKHVMEDKRGVCCLNDLFHLSPFMILDHHTISSVDYLGPSSSIPAVGLKLQSNHNDTPARDCFLDQPGHPEVPNETFNAFRSSDDSNDDGLASSGKDHKVFPTVPSPCSSREAYLLLEVAKADRRIFLAHKALTLQIVQHNMLILQYNHMTLERAQKDIHTADQFIRHVWLTIRQSGHTPAFEYAMQEDHSHLAGTSGYLSRLLLQDVNCELLRELYEMYC